MQGVCELTDCSYLFIVLLFAAAVGAFGVSCCSARTIFTDDSHQETD